MKGLLIRAQESGAILEMIYLSDKGELTQRKIKILELTPERVRAFCLMRNKQRVFKLDNILSIRPLTNNYYKGA